MCDAQEIKAKKVLVDDNHPLKKGAELCQD